MSTRRAILKLDHVFAKTGTLRSIADPNGNLLGSPLQEDEVLVEVSEAYGPLRAGKTRVTLSPVVSTPKQVILNAPSREAVLEGLVDILEMALRGLLTANVIRDAETDWVDVGRTADKLNLPVQVAYDYLRLAKVTLKPNS